MVINILITETNNDRYVNWPHSNATHVQGVLISPKPDQEGNKLQRQKSLGFIYPIYNHNCRNISTIYIYIYIYI